MLAETLSESKLAEVRIWLKSHETTPIAGELLLRSNVVG